jgi:Tfp pilus assembly protein PilV
MPAFNRLNSDKAPAAAGLRARLAAQDGLTLIEVAVTGLMVGLISLSLVGLDAAGKTASDQRRRAQAFGVAQADQERIKGLSADQIATLNQTRTVTLDGVAYTVTSTGQFLSSSAGSASCSSSAAAADYAKVISTVDWAANRRADIVVQSVVTPRAGGSLLAQTLDQNAAPLPGVRINVAGADSSTDAVRRFGTTDSGGCTIFGTLLVGDYSVSPVLAGYVDKDGDSTPSSTVTTTAGNTTTVPFSLGQAGLLSNIAFTTVIGATTLTGQETRSLSWFNAGMATNGVTTLSSPVTQISSPQNLFPFYVTTPSTYTNNYTIWAGSCTAAKPPLPANQKLVTVNPGGVVNNVTGVNGVQMPAMGITVSYPTGATSVKPNHIKLTDSCGQTWLPDINTASGPAAPANGWLAFPGQPYGTYSICADYRFQGSAGSTNPADYRKATITGRPNTNFTTLTANPVAITTLSTTGFC